MREVGADGVERIAGEALVSYVEGVDEGPGERVTVDTEREVDAMLL